MSYAGHVLDMINRIKDNEALRKAKRSRYKKLRNAYATATVRKGPVNKPETKLSKKELEAIKEKIRNDLKRERRRAWSLTITFTLIITMLVVVLINFILSQFFGVSIY